PAANYRESALRWSGSRPTKKATTRNTEWWLQMYRAIGRRWFVAVPPHRGKIPSRHRGVSTRLPDHFRSLVMQRRFDSMGRGPRRQFTIVPTGPVRGAPRDLSARRRDVADHRVLLQGHRPRQLLLTQLAR